MPRSIVLVLLCLGSLASGCARAHAEKPGPGFAVLELFTSEGCSSCPPADATLDTLTREAKRAGRPVYTLAFHVDYWDDIGWRDPFSSKLASARQRDYAQTRGERGVYTPQLVVNGADAFVGSNAEQARAAIARGIEAPAPLHLTLTAAEEAGVINAHVRLDRPAPVDAILQIALVQPEATSEVTRGENRGRTLHHVNIVRALGAVPLRGAASGSVVLSRPEALSHQPASLTAFVQEAKTLKIVGAVSLPLPLPAS